jgi:NADPH-dependent 2,4-dienoyl-CoA reductase/sulfur reductase-like enzyme
MAAALAAADLGCQVVLVDSGPATGGQIYRAPMAAGAADAPRVSSPKMPRRLRRATAHEGIHHLPETTVWQATAPDRAAETGGEDRTGDLGGTGAPEFVLWLADGAGRAPVPTCCASAPS